MIIQDIKLCIKGFEQDKAKYIIDSILNVFTLYDKLDLRRLSSLIVSDNFNNDIDDIFQNNLVIMKNKFVMKNNTHAIVLTVKKDLEYELILVIKSSFAVNLIKEEKNKIRYKDALHIIHHELSHIHDNNKKIDFRKNILVSFKKNEVFTLCEVSWSEYIANFLSSSSAKKSEYPKFMAEKIFFCIKKAQSCANLVFENNSDINMKNLNKSVKTLIKTSSYLLGYMHGLKISLNDLSKNINAQINNSYYKKHWEDLSFEYYNIRKSYPKCFENDNNLFLIEKIIISLYLSLGFDYTNENKIKIIKDHLN